MKVENKNYFDLHVFVCTNARENGEDCASKGGQAILDELKKWSKTPEAKTQLAGKKIRINKAGCLGRCDEGVVCVAYPQGEWFVEVAANQIQELQRRLK